MHKSGQCILCEFEVKISLKFSSGFLFLIIELEIFKGYPERRGNYLFRTNDYLVLGFWVLYCESVVFLDIRWANRIKFALNCKEICNLPPFNYPQLLRRTIVLLKL